MLSANETIAFGIFVLTSPGVLLFLLSFIILIRDRNTLYSHITAMQFKDDFAWLFGGLIMAAVMWFLFSIFYGDYYLATKFYNASTNEFDWNLIFQLTIYSFVAQIFFLFGIWTFQETSKSLSCIWYCCRYLHKPTMEDLALFKSNAITVLVCLITGYLFLYCYKSYPTMF